MIFEKFKCKLCGSEEGLVTHLDNIYYSCKKYFHYEVGINRNSKEIETERFVSLDLKEEPFVNIDDHMLDWQGNYSHMIIFIDHLNKETEFLSRHFRRDIAHKEINSFDEFMVELEKVKKYSNF